MWRIVYSVWLRQLPSTGSFAALLKLAPVMDQRAALFDPLARANSTFITYIPSKDGAEGVVRKEIFHFGDYFASHSAWSFEVLQVGNSCHDLHNHLHPGRRAFALS